MLHAVLSHGTNWATIAASHTPKRATLALKNRYSTLRLRNHNTRGRLDSTASKSSSSPSNLPTGDKPSIQNSNEKGNASLADGAAEDEEADDDDENEDDGGDEDEYECSPSSMLCPKLQPTHISSPPPFPSTSSESDLWTSFNESNDLLVFPPEGFGTQDPGAEHWMNDAFSVNDAGGPSLNPNPKEGQAVYAGQTFSDNIQNAGGKEMEFDMSFANGKLTSFHSYTRVY